jgi:hypothetical protein
MTREEAIKELKIIREDYWDEYNDSMPALDMAIKALEQEPCEDCISRDSAIKAMDYDIKSFEFKSGVSRYMDDIAKLLNTIYEIQVNNIKALPSVIPQETKTGHWIPVKFRPLTDEEQKEYPDYCYMADCPMPDDGEEIFVSTKYGGVEKDECGFDDGYYLDSGYDWQTDIVAWMPLPKPYKPQESEKT